MPLRARYAAHEALVRPARPRPELWRLALGLAMVGLVAFVLSGLFNSLLLDLFPGSWRDGLAQGSNAGAMLVLLGGFGFVAIGVAVALRVLHQRSLLSVTGPVPLVLRQFLRVALLMALLMAVLLVLPPYAMSEPMRQNMPVPTWLALLPLSLLAVLVQVATEELLFRGYLQQTLAARYQATWIWLLVPSGIFALGHYLPAEAGDNALLIAIWAGAFGVLMADLTARAGSLGPAIAVHFFNNLTALVLFASPTSLNGLALYLLPYEMNDAAALRPWMAVDFALMGISWLVARLAIRR